MYYDKALSVQPTLTFALTRKNNIMYNMGQMQPQEYTLPSVFPFAHLISLELFSNIQFSSSRI